MNHRLSWSTLGGVTLALHAECVLACPYCESEIGRQVSAGIFNDGFWSNAALTLLPIPVMLVIVGLIHFGMPWPQHKAKPVRAKLRDSENN